MGLFDFLSRSAAEANNMLTDQRGTIDAPFLHSYPCGCCEFISTHLGLVLDSRFDVQIARAYDRQGNNWHFWVELEGLVLDLTAHQFEQYDAPLICLIPSPMEGYFPDVERILPRNAETAAEFSMSPKLMALLDVFAS